MAFQYTRFGSMQNRHISILPAAFSIHRLPPDAAVPECALEISPCWLARTSDELSIICESGQPIKAEQEEPGWRCFQVAGPLAFSDTGIIAEISTSLAERGISVVALSTYDTDYVLVRSESLSDAVAALRATAWTVTG